MSDSDPEAIRPPVGNAPQATPPEDNEEEPTNAEQTQQPADTRPDDRFH